MYLVLNQALGQSAAVLLVLGGRVICATSHAVARTGADLHICTHLTQANSHTVGCIRDLQDMSPRVDLLTGSPFVERLMPKTARPGTQQTLLRSQRAYAHHSVTH